MFKKFSDVVHARARVMAHVAAALLALLPGLAFAQTVTQIPLFAQPRSFVDLGNGPVEVQALLGSGAIFSSQSSGLGATASSTTVTLAATPTTPPCVGCGISGGGIPANTTVAAYSGTTITLSQAATTTTASELISWGAACPVSTQQNVVSPPASALMYFFQPAVPTTGAIPFYTLARLCMYGGTGPGFQFITFPITAH